MMMVCALVDVGPALRHSNQLRMRPLNGGQEIVEVMRDASREATNRFELLSFLELSLLVGLHRDVLDHRDAEAVPPTRSYA